jgi:CelD/BcsL family acetyltransferase involved in cellulose biosynthesis
LHIGVCVYCDAFLAGWYRKTKIQPITRGPRQMAKAAAFKVSVYDSFDASKPVWIAFESNADHSAFQTFTWMKNWYEVVAAKSNLKICITLVETPEGEPLMLLPLGIERHGFLSCLVWLGGLITDYHGPLLGKACARVVDATRFAAIWEQVQSQLPPHDAISFEAQPEFIGTQRNPFLNLPHKPNASSAHCVHLGDTLDTFLRTKRSARWLSGERRKERRLGEHGRLGFHTIRDPGVAGRYLDEMMNQKSQSYRKMGVRDLFREAAYRAFIIHLTAQHLQDNFVHLSVLTLDDRPLAAHWGLVHEGRFYHLFPSYAQDEFARYSPGNILFRRVLGWCMQNGIDVYDFTIGDEAYKYDWSDKELRLFDCTKAVTMRGWLYTAPVSLKRYGKHRIKHSPTLWRIAKIMRARMAQLVPNQGVGAQTR